MAEYIEREAAYNLAKTTLRHLDFHESMADLTSLKELLDDTPAADVVEVVHGEWLDNGDRDRNGVPKPFAISCSVCGSSAGTDWMKYCPNCGAKMDGKGIDNG